MHSFKAFKTFNGKLGPSESCWCKQSEGAGEGGGFLWGGGEVQQQSNEPSA